MRRGTRRFAAVLLAVLLLATATIPAPVAATHESCTEVDEFFWVLSIGFVNQHCDADELSKHADDLEAAHQNATEVEVYNTGQLVVSDWEQYDAVISNYLEDSRTVAMAKAEAAAVEEIDSGGTRAEVETAAEDAVSDYYSQKQINLADQYSVAAQTVGTMENTSDVAGLSESFVDVNSEVTGGSYDNNVIIGDHDGGNPGNLLQYPVTGTKQITLHNGSTIITHGLQIAANDGDTNNGGTYLYVVNSGEPEIMNIWTVHDIHVDPVDTNPSYIVLDFEEYKTRWDEIDSEATAVEANAVTYAGALYNATSDGNASTADYVSGYTLAQEFSTDYESTGKFSYVVGMAAASGMVVPDLGNTSLMTISVAGETYTGLLMSQSSPANGYWEVNKTYNALDINGSQYVATTDKGVVELDGPFVIESMEDADGNSVSVTTAEEHTYETTNVSDNYAALQEELRSLRAEIEAVPSPTSSGGGGSVGGGGWLAAFSKTQLLVAGVVIGGLLLLLARD